MEDRRVRKTKQQLQQALATLMVEKSVNRITVKELCEVVDINRTTFYAHYQDVYDLLEQLEHSIAIAFREIADQHPLSIEHFDLFPMEVDIFRYLARETAITKALFCHHGSMTLIDTIYQVIKEYYEMYWHQLLPVDENISWKYSFHYVISGCVGLMQHWLETGMKETPEQMAELMSCLISQGIHGYSKSLSNKAARK